MSPCCQGRHRNPMLLDIFILLMTLGGLVGIVWAAYANWIEPRMHPVLEAR